MVRHLILQCISGALKHDFRTNIRRYTSPNEHFEYGYPHSNALLTPSLPYHEQFFDMLSLENVISDIVPNVSNKQEKIWCKSLQWL